MAAIKSPFIIKRDYHEFPKSWNKNYWLVPFHDGQGIIYHGHNDKDDHSLCGPQIFCCYKAKRLLHQYHPDALDDADCEPTDGRDLIDWVINGVKVFYFFFCHPQEKSTLLFAGIETPDLQKVLLRQYPLEYYVGHADIISGKGQ